MTPLPHRNHPTRGVLHFRTPTVLLLAGLLLSHATVACRTGDPEKHEHEERESGERHEHSDEHGHGGGDHGHGEEEGNSDEVALSEDAVNRYGVKVTAVTRVALSNSYTAAARVAYNGDAIAEVGAAAPGRVSELRVGLGGRVKKGDVLLVLESPAFGEAQGEYRAKHAAVAAARASLGRAQTLLKDSQGISVGEVQKREVELRAAEAAASVAESRLKLYGLTPARIQALLASPETDPRFQVVSPVSGTVVDRTVVLGELVGPERDSLVTVADLETLWVVASVPEARLKDVGPGYAARVSVPAYPGEWFPGVVAVIAPALDPVTRAAEVRIEAKNRGAVLKPAMFAEALISAPEAGDGQVLAVAADAVQTVEGGPAVFVPVPGEDNTFAKRAVTVGPATGGLVPVLSGLSEGEEYVSSGSFILKAELGKAGAAHDH